MKLNQTRPIQQQRQILATDRLPRPKFPRKGRHQHHAPGSRACTCAQCKHVPGPGAGVSAACLRSRSPRDTTPTHEQRVSRSPAADLYIPQHACSTDELQAPACLSGMFRSLCILYFYIFKMKFSIFEILNVD